VECPSAFQPPQVSYELGVLATAAVVKEAEMAVVTEAVVMEEEVKVAAVMEGVVKEEAERAEVRVVVAMVVEVRAEE